MSFFQKPLRHLVLDIDPAAVPFVRPLLLLGGLPEDRARAARPQRGQREARARPRPLPRRHLLPGAGA